jgi:tetratricopeptide (TPR) repeat protein
MRIIEKKPSLMPTVVPILVLGLLLSSPWICGSAESKGNLTVKEIAFAFDGEGKEKVSIFCSRSCIPVLFQVEGGSPRVVMDLRDVSLLQTRARQISTGGKFVKGIRTYLDRETKILRIVLDMDPSAYLLVYPAQDSSEAYVLTIEEISPPAQQPEGSGNESPPRESRMTILESRQRLAGKQGGVIETAPPPRQETGKAAGSQTAPSADQGRTQLNSGDFNAAIETFSRILAAQPRDSLSYRLRGNAYDNLGDRQKALEDWAQAARLGDGLLQSYLDFLQVQWRDTAAP